MSAADISGKNLSSLWSLKTFPLPGTSSLLSCWEFNVPDLFFFTHVSLGSPPGHQQRLTKVRFLNVTHSHSTRSFFFLLLHSITYIITHSAVVKFELKGLLLYIKYAP